MRADLIQLLRRRMKMRGGGPLRVVAVCCERFVRVWCASAVSAMGSWSLEIERDARGAAAMLAVSAIRLVAKWCYTT